MPTLREWLNRLWGTLRQKSAERDLEEELRLHLELAGQDLRRHGRLPAEALRIARIHAGGVAQAMDALRDQRGLPWLDDLAGDIRHGLRTLRHTPTFTAIALLTLAMGIGANTAIFSIVNGVLLRPLGYPEPARLMYLTTTYPTVGITTFWVSPPEYLEFREINRSFSAVGAYRTGEVNVTAGDRPLRVRSVSVDDQLLNALGVQAALGRLFAKGETEVSGPPPTPGQPPPLPPPIAILSAELWQTAFGGRPIVGQTVEINGRRHEIIGIMPPGTDVMDNRTEIWLPLGLNPVNRQNRGNHTLYLVGRLRDGVTRSSAQRELNTLMQNWGERVGAKGHVLFPSGTGAHILRMTSMQGEILGSAGGSIWTLQAAVGLVLLIACANLASLLMARAETRHREFAVRTALGASRGRLVRQFMTEGVMVSIAGGALGLLLARIGVAAVIRAYPNSLPRMHEVTVDPLVLLATLGVSAATGVLCGLVPLVHTGVTGLATALKEGGIRGATSSTRHRIRRGLVMGEVALAVMLVIGAGLLVRTVSNLANVDAGFNRSHLVTWSLTLPQATYPQASTRAEMYQRLLGQLRALPGVEAATAMSGLPPNRPFTGNYTDIEHHTPPPDRPYETIDFDQFVMADYFDTMGIALVQGRSFQAADTAGSGLVGVVNEALAHSFWKGQNPIGRRLRPARPTGSEPSPWFTVIGVAKDVKQGGVDQKTGTEMYFSVEQVANLPLRFAVAPLTMNVVLRTTLPLAAVSHTIERVVRGVDGSIPTVELRDMDGVFAESIRRQRLLAHLVAGFAGLALSLAAIGTYGLLSYIVAERRREIGIRMALGASRSQVLGQIMTQGLQLTAIGVAAGLAGAFGLNRLIRSLLFGVQPTDAPTLAAVMATIALVAVVACGLPAWRASRLDPNVTLRED